jgi:hypothetical protein
MPVHIPPGGEIPASPMIISETETHIVVAVEISKSTLFRHMRFLENLVDAGTRGEAEG